ncbi:hypothetical protein BGW39_011092 [Mortierella sp. 14UC]|nr:hypothetical protein BGW39_011092 [Mortierella sp. 14UC]
MIAGRSPKLITQAMNLLRQSPEYKPENCIDLVGLINYDFFRCGYCPDSLPETAFNMPPIFIDSYAEEGSTSKTENSGVKIEGEDKEKAVKRPVAEDTE